MREFLIKTVLAILVVVVLIGTFFWHEIATKLAHETATSLSDSPAGLCVSGDIIEGGYLPLKSVNDRGMR